ncbi:hypothetical protein F2Q68_00024571 [Brassica cretica]|uniref:Uncharacterized protein n=1 Tax=Brassica cretica TaxID=69181 RepID=A0A8S9IFJ5_BRACR|nr:hypothetical protein F2Q68_00024571 [Brassica cretica]
MNSCCQKHSSFLKLLHFFTPKSFVASQQRKLTAFTVATTMEEASDTKGFNTDGMYAGLRASGKKPDLGLVTCDVDVVAAVIFFSGVAVICLFCRLELTPPLLQMGYLNKNDRVAVGEELSYMEKNLLNVVQAGGGRAVEMRAAAETEEVN